ncbi:glycosyltransferase family 2 protein [Methylomonas sp. AM2-LC]|uniref:glycosyltransferase family 2 protein n=1 Tax=Methylomonas sp. AM2-LC TaxID=3153301 RepID=UPI0032635E91
MKIWICIPVFNRSAFTLKCLTSLSTQTFQQFTIVVCDHGSTDGTSDAIRQQFPEVVVINANNSLWWTGAINRSIAYALEHANNDDLLLTMNNDNEVPSDYLQNLLNNYHQHPNAIITSVIHDIKTGELVSWGYRQNWLYATAYPVNFAKEHIPDDTTLAEVTHASGRGTLFPISVFREIGLYDEQHLPHYLADYDLTFKAARAGYRIYSSLNCKVFSYIDETGLVKVLNKFTLSSFINYFTSIRSPGNLKARWWFAWHNCPRWLLPIYVSLDLLRVSGGYFKNILSL